MLNVLASYKNPNQISCLVSRYNIFTCLSVLTKNLFHVVIVPQNVQVISWLLVFGMLLMMYHK